MSATEDAARFDLCGPLPTGVTVLEASAGTGKTYTIAALAARYVAEGVPLDQLLVVSFTRAATGELRDRVRERLSTAREALDSVLAGVRAPRGDELVRLLVDGTEDEVGARRDRLARANADFDAATITTTHGFCGEALGGLGIAGDMDRAHRFSANADDLLAEVIGDLYIRRFLKQPAALTRAEAREIGRIAVDNPSADLEPAAEAQAQTDPGMRYRLAERSRFEFDRRKRAAALMTYDDLVTRLRSTLEGLEGPLVAQALRRRYRVALIDEFQDTDPDQWAILREAFAHDGTTLVLIGDPKQAIYSFRGAEVYSYLAARDEANARPTLRINWRSDQGLLEAYNALFRRARLGHEDIVYRPLQAAEANKAARLSGAPVASPLRIRVVVRTTPSIETTKKKGHPKVPSSRLHVAKDVAGDVVTLLDSAAEIETRHDDGSPLSRQVVQPGDVAVLTRTNKQATMIKAELDSVGVPAVVNGAGSVFATDAAQDWLRLLDALERPDVIRRTRGVALTRFVGWATERVACATDTDWDELQQRLHRWAKVLRDKGVAALLEAITQNQRLPGRLLGEPGGERVLTDLRHVGELLHVAAIENRLGVTALAGWLRQRLASDDPDADADDRTRRLESDAEAVQILTVHRSKGLEFPIVYCPYLWEIVRRPDQLRPATFHDAANDDARTIDVTMETSSPSYRRHVRQADIEDLGEELRLAYVALTRAKHQAVIWWAGTWDSCKSPLHRLVFDQDTDGNVPLPNRQVPTDKNAVLRFQDLGRLAPGQISVERSTVDGPEVWVHQTSRLAKLTAASFTRTLDQSWRRTSYTAITAGAYEARVASEIEEAVGADDQAVERPLAVSAEPGAADQATATVPLSDMPVGARIGSFVHRVLEATDFAADDLDPELAGHVADAQRRRRLDIGDRDGLVAGLHAAIETPLGPLGHDRRLRDLQRGDRLDELAFELPLVGGDTPTGELTLDAIATTLDRHLPTDDPLAGYPDRLTDPGLRPSLRGYLVGTIDLVARDRHLPSRPAFSIVDYKTNRLALPSEPLTIWHHRPTALAAEMQRAHYALQALLYSVALHRYLRWRVPSYDPLRDRPAILYLFLRGMVGAATPLSDGTPHGVFAWRPPAGLIPDLSDLLDRGAPA